MRKWYPLLVITILLSGCANNREFRAEQERILERYRNGEYTLAGKMIANDLQQKGLHKDQKDWLIMRQAIMDRTRIDFSRSLRDVKSQLSAYYPVIPEGLLSDWESLGHLEMKQIDGAKKYFRNAVSNLFRLDTAAAAVRRSLRGTYADPLDSIKLRNTSEIVETGRTGIPSVWQRITLEYTLTVDAGVTPDGSTIRCWLPYPRESAPRQVNIQLLASNPAGMKKSGPNALHSSLYSEKTAVSGLPTVFSYKASFDIAGEWFDPATIESARKGAPWPGNRYTREVPPHVVFSPAVKQLADSLSEGEKDSFRILRAFYYWIDANIPWASALEYSTFECIPDYVIRWKHGDCGMKTFLLMSMARYKGIPARWQSGWMLHPGEENLHDWCEIWLPATGWIPVDMSFGLQNTENPALRDFYLTGIDSYRMIVNDGFAQPFDPPKTHIRSEPFDFQRGEVETEAGNLYFNQWDYHLNVISIEKITR